MTNGQRAIALQLGEPEVPFTANFTVTVDLSVFPKDVVLRACYAFADRCYCWIQSEGAGRLLIAFKDRKGKLDPETVRGEFANALVDFALRAVIEANTAEVRKAIVTAALTEASGCLSAGQ